jgi:hypothetical protein
MRDQARHCMKHLDFSGHILSETKYFVSHKRLSLMDETNNRVKPVRRSPADKVVLVVT